MSEIEKKPVLIRVPKDMYDWLLKGSVKQTEKRGKTVSVPSTVIEKLTEVMNQELAEAMNKPGKEYENG